MTSSASQTQAQHHHRVDYLELPATDIAATKQFYTTVFGWHFEDYGPEYTSFQDGRMSGGFFKAPSVSPGGALLVIYSRDLEASLARVRQTGARIVKETFSFPGGRRFHFADPSGNELAVWTEP
ncbi:bleomycin resistance protein [Cystobacter fuscus]|uniref:Bleomycin resistance protein n=1 Tax=Cystobacter fuscus TaxID=43 RepID=A0A250J3M5_9BACT|nr:VOC family protein [Cystobacter fuscus]ATB38569.1 bleomycin resistance protein [Cystobacter fuscus]